MNREKLARQEQKDVDNAKQHPNEHELLVQIVKLQMMLNSKMFEFMRAYQQHHNFGEHGVFRGGSNGKTRIGRLFDEVNEIGITLSRLVSAFVGENLYEKRDEEGRVLACCNHCQKECPFVKIIDAPYGMTEAYIYGTERLICSICKKDTIYPWDARLPKFNSVFRTK